MRSAKTGLFVAPLVCGAVIPLLLVAAGATWTLMNRRGTDAALAASGVESPRIALSTHRVDLGDGKPRETLCGNLVLTNVSAGALEYSVTASCGCIRPQPFKGAIAPGEKQTIELGIKLPHHANWEKSAIITVHGKDAEREKDSREEGTCALIARCPAPFIVSPGFIDFGNVSREQSDGLTAESRVESVPGKPAVSIEALQIELDHDSFRVAASAANDGTVSLRVTPAPDLPSGDHSATAELRLGGSDYVMRLPLHARLVEPVLVVPAKVVLRKDPATGRFRPATILVISRATAVTPGAVRLLDGPTGLILDDDVAGERQRRIRFSVKGDLPASESVVQLGADDVENELSFKLVVQEP